jgi:hypothetical protein
MSTDTREERLARRVADLYATDQQFADARPSEALTAAIDQPRAAVQDAKIGSDKEIPHVSPPITFNGRHQLVEAKRMPGARHPPSHALYVRTTSIRHPEPAGTH